MPTRKKRILAIDDEELYGLSVVARQHLNNWSHDMYNRTVAIEDSFIAMRQIEK